MNLTKHLPFLEKKVEQGNKDLDKGLITFSMRVYSLSENQLISALHSFGESFLSKSRRRMQVQPDSVVRRKSKIRKRQSKTQEVLYVLYIFLLVQLQL